MKIEYGPQHEREATKRRRSMWISIGVVTAIVVGVPVLFSQCSGDDDQDPVVAGQSYTNNHYIPSVGYYHAGFLSFFPFRYNHYDPGRGYYYGGSWNPAADTSRNVASSVPDRSAVTSANAAHRAANPSKRGGFGRTGSVFSSRS